MLSTKSCDPTESLSAPQQKKQHLIQALQEKRQHLKTLKDKSELQNKKIKLFRKQNEDLKVFIEQRNQQNTNMLLQSKEYIANNDKMEKTIHDLAEQLEAHQKAAEESGGQRLSASNRTQGADQSLKNEQKRSQEYMQLKNIKPKSLLVTIRETTLNEDTVELDLPACGLKDEQIVEEIGYLTQLKTLLLNDNLLTDSSIGVICERLRSLEKLNLAGNGLKKDESSGSSLGEVSSKSSCVELSVEGFKHLPNLKMLRYLDLRNNNLGDAILPLVNQLHLLEEFSCSKNRLSAECLSDEGVLSNLSQNLRYLDMTNNDLVAVDGLLGLKRLTHLYLMSNRIPKQGVMRLLTEKRKVGSEQGQKEELAVKSLQFLDVRFNIWDEKDKNQIRELKREGLGLFV